MKSLLSLLHPTALRTATRMHKSQRVRTQSPTGQQSFSPEGSLWPDQGRLFQTWILNMVVNMGGFGSRMQGLARTCPIKRRCLEQALQDRGIHHSDEQADPHGSRGTFQNST